MRLIFFILTILIFCFKTKAQQKDDFKIMIDSAISIKYSQFFKVVSNQNNKYYLENLYLLDEQDQPFINLLLSKKFKSINVYDKRNRKIIKKGIYAWRVFTVLNKNQFVVNIVDFYITYKDHNYSFGNGGGSKTIFEYDCSEIRWKFISSQNIGI